MTNRQIHRKVRKAKGVQKAVMQRGETHVEDTTTKEAQLEVCLVTIKSPVLSPFLLDGEFFSDIYSNVNETPI